MPRNRKRRAPIVVEARLVRKPLLSVGRQADLRRTGGANTKYEDATVVTTARCGSCGQLLPGVGNVLGLQKWGYRLDGDTLRPTKHHRAQRQRAQETVSQGAALSPAELTRLLQKLRSSSFSRGAGISGGPRVNNQSWAGLKIECPECGAENQLPDETPIWASHIFPNRLPATPELVLRPNAGVSVHSLRDQLSYFHNLTSPNAWTGHFRGSPVSIKPEDAAIIEAAPRSAAKVWTHKTRPGRVRTGRDILGHDGGAEQERGDEGQHNQEEEPDEALAIWCNVRV